MPHFTTPFRRTMTFGLLCLVALVAQPAAADWLITLEGRMIETQGPWSIDGRTLTYVDVDGIEQSLAVDDVDLEASKETTALKAGKTYEPPKNVRPEPFELESPTAAARAGEEPKITLYMTSWCGYCRKASKLLKELDADFVSKDVEKNRKAAAEFRRKNGGRGGVPLIDIDGELVRGYNAKMIRELVAELQAK